MVTFRRSSGLPLQNVCNRGIKSARKKRPQEVIEEEKEKKRIDMINQRLSLETNPNPIIKDTTVHPINPTQEKKKHSLKGPSIFTIVIEQEPCGSIQQANCRFSLGDVSCFSLGLGAQWA